MNRAIIFLNGDLGDYSRLAEYINDDTLLIGCDGGGGKMMKLGYRPHALVGDFDSFDENPPEDIERIKYPKDKDFTDSEAAVRYAVSKGIEEIILTGVLGSRVDHLLGNIFLLDKPEFSGAALKIVEGRQEIYLISGETAIKGKKGDLISFMPLLGDVQAKFSAGLKYDLAEYLLSMQGNPGISNEFISGEVTVGLASGHLLVVHELS